MYKVQIRLRQHTPLIHFQGDQPGACLRASEVKTKLDRYLVMNFGSEFRNETGNFIEDYFVDREHKALDYKMRISFRGNPREEPPFRKKTNTKGRTRHEPTVSSYYAPLVDEDKAKYDHVRLVTYEDIVVDLFSFHPGLLDIIKKHIAAFFAVTNFGARSSKGFGSFSVASIDNTPVSETIKDLLQGRTYIEFWFGNDAKDNTRIMEHVYTFYQVLKSGINLGLDKEGKEQYEPSFLMKKYMVKKGIGSEKAFIKKYMLTEEELKKLSSRNQNSPHSDFRYVRGMLGVAPFAVFRKGNQKDNKVEVQIVVGSDEVKRFKSPITIKIVDNTAYFIAEKIPEAMYEREFTFTRKASRDSERDDEGRRIKTPSKSEFDLGDLLRSFAREIENRKKQVGSVSVRRYKEALRDLVQVTFVKGESMG